MIQLNDSGVSVNCDMFKTSASELFRKTQDFKGPTEPKWSNGWLARFKQRFGGDYEIMAEMVRLSDGRSNGPVVA